MSVSVKINRGLNVSVGWKNGPVLRVRRTSFMGPKSKTQCHTFSKYPSLFGVTSIAWKPLNLLNVLPHRSSSNSPV